MDNIEDFEVNQTTEQIYYLEKLSGILNYHLSSSLLFLLSFLWGVLLFITVIAAAIFSIYLLYIIFRLKKISWFISLFTIVGIPIIVSYILGLIVGYIVVFLFIPLALFYIYCFTLKFVVNDQLSELRAKEDLRREEALKKAQES
jgi:hypothetical protein